MDTLAHWKLPVQTYIWYIYGYSRTMKTVAVQITHTVQNTENCSSAKHWYSAFTDIPKPWKTVPVQNIDTVHLQIFQKTERLSQCKTLILCISGYSRTLQTVPVQYTDTVHLWTFQKTVQNIGQLCTYRYSRTLNTIPVCSNDIHKHLKLCSYEHIYKC